MITHKVGTIGTHATTVEHFANGNVKVTYHNTRIAFLNPQHRRVRLDSGGWRTATTKRRMNQVLESYNIPLRVVQRDFAWFVESANGTVPFSDNATIHY